MTTTTPAKNRTVSEPPLSPLPPNHSYTTVNPPYVNASQTRPPTDIKLVGCNSCCKIYLSKYFRLLPKSELLATYEIGQPVEKFREAATRHQWVPVVVASISENNCDVARSAILLRANTPCYTTKTGTYHTACYADIKLPTSSIRIISVYVQCNRSGEQMTNLGSWIRKTERESPHDTIIIGDFNVRTTPTVEAVVRGGNYRELVRGRTTFARSKTQRSSLDRVFVQRGCKLNLEQISFTGASDHAALTVNIRQTLANPIPSMQQPPAGFKLGLKELDCIIQGKPEWINVRPAPKPKCPRLWRLSKALQCRLVLRSQHAARKEWDATANLNRQIKDIRDKMDFLIQGTASNDMQTRRLPYQPPKVENPGVFVEHFRKRFAASEQRASGMTGSAISLECDDVSRAIASMRTSSRTTDYSLRFFNNVKDDILQKLTIRFNEWLRCGIPPKESTSWIFLAWKLGSRKRQHPKSFRPVAIMPLLLKILHTALYVRLKEDIYREVREKNFQYGSVRKTGMVEIIYNAQKWLDENYANDLDDEHVVLITDLLAAYDSVPHDGVVHTLQNIMGSRWAATAQRVLEAQTVSLTFYDGFSTPFRLGKGLLQGSPLSVLLYLLYTAYPPPGLQTSKAFVDDITTLTTKGRVEHDLQLIESWASDLQLELAWSKTTVISKTIFNFTDNSGNSKVSTASARLLGACVHGNKKIANCEQNASKTERLCRVIDHITSSRYTPTKRKVEQYKCYALPVLSLHSLSKCFDPAEQKIAAACGRLIPSHPRGCGIKHFATSKHGFGRTPVVDYTEAVRTHAHLVSTNYRSEEALPAEGFRRRAPRDGDTPTVIQDIQQQLDTFSGNRDLVVASDGGYFEDDNTGTIGISINGVKHGAKIRGKVLSSTHAELAAAITLATALKGSTHRFRVVWWCDSRNAIARQTAKDPMDPASCVLGAPGMPLMSWAKGHSKNVHINAADEAATQARVLPSTLDVEVCLARHNIPFICFSEKVVVTQLSSPMHFIRQVKAMNREAGIATRIREQCPQECTKRQNLRRLMYIPGCCDIMQAIARRAVLQRSTKAKCAIPQCDGLATAEHVLLCNSPAHRRALSRFADIEKVYPSPPTVHTVLRDFAMRRPPTLMMVCERMKVQEADDVRMSEWCDGLHKWLMLRVEFRERI